MSAINAFVARDAIHVFTDTGAYAADGTLRLSRTKIDVLATMPGIIASTGPIDLTRALAFEIGMKDPKTFSEIVADLDEYASAAMDLLVRAGEVGTDTFEIIIAVYDEAEDRPRLARAVCVDGSVTVAESNLFRSPRLAPGDVPYYDTDKPRESGLALLEAQRRTLCGITAIPGSAAHLVGGCAQHTVVSRDGVTTSIIRRWPDVVGRKIVPEGVMSVAA